MCVLNFTLNSFAFYLFCFICFLLICWFSLSLSKMLLDFFCLFVCLFVCLFLHSRLRVHTSHYEGSTSHTSSLPSPPPYSPPQAPQGCQCPHLTQPPYQTFKLSGVSSLLRIRCIFSDWTQNWKSVLEASSQLEASSMLLHWWSSV